MKQTAASELPAKHKNASHPSGWLVFFIFEFVRLWIQFFTCLFINPPSRLPPRSVLLSLRSEVAAGNPHPREGGESLPVGLRIDNVIK